MLNNLRYILIIISVLGVLMSGCKKEEEKVFLATPGLDDPSYQYPIVRMETNKGTIFIWLYYQTPLHRDNFISLVTQEFYDGLIFHRVIDAFMIPIVGLLNGIVYSHVIDPVGSVRASVRSLRTTANKTSPSPITCRGTPYLSKKRPIFGINSSILAR